MKVIWLHYGSAKNPRYILFLEIGRSSDKIIGIESSEISNGMKSKIRSAKSVLNNMTLEKRVDWFKRNCPILMKKCKTLSIKKTRVLKSYDFGT